MKMENDFEEKTTAEIINEYANLLWRWAWLLVLFTLLAGGITYWVSSHQTSVYQASTLVMIDVAPTSQTQSYTTVTTSEQLAATYSQLMTSKPVLDGVAKRLGLAGFPASATVQVTPVQSTQLMTVIVEDTNAKRAAQLANTLVQVFSDQIQADQASRYADSNKSVQDQLSSLNQQIQTTSSTLAALGTSSSNQVEHDQLEAVLAQYRQSYASVFQSYEDIQLAEAQSSSGITQKDPAITPIAPVTPRPVRDAILAAVVGLLIACGVVFLIEFLDDTIRDPQEITRKWGLPVLGVIASYDTSNGNMIITAKQPRSPVSEAFRSLRTNLQFSSVNMPIHTLLVTSASPKDGKTTIAANLGSIIAQSGRSVVVVDADLRRPMIHKILQLSNRVGLTDQFIRPQSNFDGALKKTEVEGFQALTSGSLPPNPSELLGSERMAGILNQLTKQFDTVIIDAPPMMLVTDALVLAPSVDGVIVIVKPSVTKRAGLKYLLDQLHQVKANVIGVVLNDVQINRSQHYYYHGYYRKYRKDYPYIDDTSKPAEKQGVVAAENDVVKKL